MTSSSVASLRVEPVAVGPSWRREPDGSWALPELSIGYEIAAEWVPQNLQMPDGSPFELTAEQTRLLVWWYAHDERGRFLYRDGVVQRIKGWGKDPFAAVIAAVEFVGPCRVGEFGAIENPAAWVQIAATSKDQTRNTMTLFPALFTKRCIEEHQIDLGKEIIYGYKGARRIEAVTSNPRTLEGGRPTFTIANETQHWLADSNAGQAMWAVIQRNAMKAPNGTSRVLAITNAYNPSEDSVAQRTREAWEKQTSGDFLDSGIMYDSLEAPPDAPLTAEAAPLVIEKVRGDSHWVDPESYAKFVIDSRTPPSEARRFAYNQITATEDAWLDPNQIQLAVHDLPVTLADEWALFFDGSKSDDATGLVGCRLSDGHLVTFGVWEKPAGGRGESWVVDRAVVDATVREVFKVRKVRAFWADPSHAKDDEGFGYWDALIDGWHRDFGGELKFWSVQSGHSRHSIMWDMSKPSNQQLFVAAAEAFTEDVAGGLVTIDGHPLLVAHLRNARRYPTKHGLSLSKEHRESARKIDLAVCAVGARMLRRMVLNRGDKKRPGKWMTGGKQPCLCGCGEQTETGFKSAACKARFEEAGGA